MNENDLFEEAWKSYRRGVVDNSHLNSALLLLDRIIEHNPNCASAYSLRADVRRLQSDYGGALEDADRAIKLEPYGRGHYYNRGYYRERIKDYAGALSDFRYAQELAIEQDDYGLVDAADHHIPDLEQRLGLSE